MAVSTKTPPIGLGAVVDVVKACNRYRKLATTSLDMVRLVFLASNGYL